MIASIITPTYNRKKYLPKLYNSLLKQTCKDFEWIVIDDGSTDDTESLINNFVNESRIKIIYVKKQNGGRHTALNIGFAKAKGKMIIMVDSDDYLTDDAVETVKYYYKKYNSTKDICGFSFLKTVNGAVVGKEYPNDEFIENYINCRIKKNIFGDKAEVFFSKIIKEYSFPEIENEKFLSEDILWLEIAKKYNTLYVNKSIYNCEYLQDGLSANDKKSKFNSPIGSALRGLSFIRSSLPIKYKLKGAIIYNCYNKEIKNKNDILKLVSAKEKILIFITIPLGWYFNKKWKAMF